MDAFFRLRKYVEYQWKAKTKYYIHSPFVYQFYLNILEGDERIPLKSKDEKLLYKLIKYFNPQHVLLLGDCDYNSLCWTGGNPPAKNILLHDSQIIHSKNSTPFDFILCGDNYSRQNILDSFHQCVSDMNENSVFILAGIYRNKELNGAWKEIKTNSQVTLTIDVFQFGICFFRKDKLAKENFVLRY